MTKSSIQPEDKSFHPHFGLAFNEEISEILHFEHRDLWC
jgi:2'-5' RNA ligase